MNKIFRSKNKTMPVAVMIGAFVLFPIQHVFAQLHYKVEVNRVDKATLNGWNIYRTEAVINQLERATSVILIYSTA